MAQVLRHNKTGDIYRIAEGWGQSAATFGNPVQVRVDCVRRGKTVQERRAWIVFDQNFTLADVHSEVIEDAEAERAMERLCLRSHPHKVSPPDYFVPAPTFTERSEKSVIGNTEWIGKETRRLLDRTYAYLFKPSVVELSILKFDLKNLFDIIAKSEKGGLDGNAKAVS